MKMHMETNWKCKSINCKGEKNTKTNNTNKTAAKCKREDQINEHELTSDATTWSQAS